MRLFPFSNPSVATSTSQLIFLIIQPFRHSSFSNLSDASPTSQLILQPFRRFTYVTAQSPSLPSLHLRHSSFYNPSVASPTSQLYSTTLLSLHLRHSSFYNPCRFTYVKAHCTTLPSLHLRHSSFYNLSVASPTSQLILQPFCRFTYVSWRAAHCFMSIRI